RCSCPEERFFLRRLASLGFGAKPSSGAARAGSAVLLSGGAFLSSAPRFARLWRETLLRSCPRRQRGALVRRSVSFFGASLRSALARNPPPELPAPAARRSARRPHLDRQLQAV